MEVVRGFVVASLVCVSLGYEIHYAVNFGNLGGFNDSQGIVYEKEASSYSKTMTSSKISGTNDHDLKLYQYCNYDSSSMMYYISDVKESGQYLLVFKQFADSHHKMLNMILNGQHQAVTKLSIYDQVGHHAAYDEYVYFSVCNDQLLYKNQKSAIKNNKISVEFQNINGSYVYMSAMILVRGDVENFPIPSSLLYRLSKDAEISQLYQQLMHSCVKKPTDVEIIPVNTKERTQTSLIEPTQTSVRPKFGLNLSLSNFSFGNMNFFSAKSHADTESDILVADERA
jgi:Malectin domain